MKNELPDIHSTQPEVPLPIKAGLDNLVIHSLLDIGGECTPITLKTTAVVLLPESMRGVHMSRFVKVIDSIISTDADKCRSPYELLDSITSNILKAHEYAEEASVRIKGEAASPHNAHFKFSIQKTINRHGKEKWVVSVSTRGSTACPSAKEVYSFVEKNKKPPTHMQRAESTVTLVLTSRPHINLNKLAHHIEKGFSGKLYRNLDRFREYEVVKQAVEKPRFTEDVARTILKILEEQFSDDDSVIEVKVTVKSMESIHPFDIIAEARIKR